MSYRDWLVKEEAIWKRRPVLWQALHDAGVVLEEPLMLATTHPDDAQGSTTTLEPTVKPAEHPAAEVDYVFDFGKHAGKRWGEVPQSYLDWLMKEGVWEKRPVLWQALSEAGVVLEEPRPMTSLHQDDVQGSTTTLEPPVKPAEHAAAEVDYAFDFGKHSGIQWGEVPMPYRDWLVKVEVIWKRRPVLWQALYDAGIVLEEPPRLLYSDQNAV
jgi:uncharacterized protein (DUF3820 family)